MKRGSADLEHPLQLQRPVLGSGAVPAVLPSGAVQGSSEWDTSFAEPKAGQTPAGGVPVQQPAPGLSGRQLSLLDM